FASRFARSRRNAADEKRTRAAALARLRVASFPETSTMRASPRALTWVSFARLTRGLWRMDAPCGLGYPGRPPRSDPMSDAVADLSPRPLWQLFARLAAIPRPSGREEAAARFVQEVGTAAGAMIRRDRRGNVVLAVPASPGREGAPPLVLQGHLDMVCEKNSGVEHDFERDPIRPRLDGEWVRATG